jgi:2-phospho-L-lactate guanylyltransferase
MTPDGRWVAVVPVKELLVAKTRLLLPSPHRQDLALAMACDVVAACVSAAIDATVVVTNDPRAAAELGALGATVVADASDAGLNPALVDGARHAAGWHPRAGLVAVSSDLAALRADVLDEVVDAAGAFDRSVVADAAGTGTTLLLARSGADFMPDFGSGSRNRHVQQGAAELDPSRWPEARRDVDTLDDLAAAASLGLGTHTAAVVARLGLGASVDR